MFIQCLCTIIRCIHAFRKILGGNLWNVGAIREPWDLEMVRDLGCPAYPVLSLGFDNTCMHTFLPHFVLSGEDFGECFWAFLELGNFGNSSLLRFVRYPRP